MIKNIAICVLLAVIMLGSLAPTREANLLNALYEKNNEIANLKAQLAACQKDKETYRLNYLSQRAREDGLKMDYATQMSSYQFFRNVVQRNSAGKVSWDERGRTLTFLKKGDYYLTQVMGTGSMAPIASPNVTSTVIMRLHPALEELQVGDAISFGNPYGGATIHMIVSIEGENIITKGAANQNIDSPIKYPQVGGVVVAYIRSNETEMG